MDKSSDVTTSALDSNPHERLSPLVLGPAGALRASLVGWSEEGRPLVTLDGEPYGPVPATTCVDLSGITPADANLVVVLEHGDERRPIVIGVLRPASAPSAHTSMQPPLQAEVQIDGQITKVTARKELSLTCGKASITLRADGRITIRGAQVSSEANGVNRIRGGSIELN